MPTVAWARLRELCGCTKPISLCGFIGAGNGIESLRGSHVSVSGSNSFTV